MKDGIEHPAQTDIQEVTRGMRLVNPRIKMLHPQREIHRIQVVEIMAPKHEARDGNRARQKHERQLLPVSHGQH